MKLKINSCGYSDCSPSWNWITSKNGFPDYDLWIVFRGRGHIGPANDPEKTVHVHEGAGLILTPDTQFIAEHEPNHPLYTIHAHFEYLDDNGKPVRPHGLLTRSITDISLMRSLLMRMVMFFHSNRKEDAATMLAAALVEFEHSEPLTNNKNDSQWSHIISEISAEIDAGGPIPTLAEYAERYAYSERYIGKMFMKLQGISFTEYTRNSRISRAKSLLRHTDAPISAIAEETGFYDVCHFSKTFHTAVGISPLTYRNKR